MTFGLQLSKARANYFKKVSAFMGVKLWNSFPSSLKEVLVRKKFKADIRSYKLHCISHKHDLLFFLPF